MTSQLGSSNFSNSIGCVLQRHTYMAHPECSILGLDGDAQATPVLSPAGCISEKGKVGRNLALVAFEFFTKPGSE